MALHIAMVIFIHHTAWEHEPSEQERQPPWNGKDKHHPHRMLLHQSVGSIQWSALPYCPWTSSASFDMTVVPAIDTIRSSIGLPMYLFMYRSLNWTAKVCKKSWLAIVQTTWSNKVILHTIFALVIRVLLTVHTKSGIFGKFTAATWAIWICILFVNVTSFPYQQYLSNPEKVRGPYCPVFLEFTYTSSYDFCNHWKLKLKLMRINKHLL